MTTTTVTYRKYRAMGFTDDVTECDLCGRRELKGTVRLAILDADGNEEGDLYAGVVCAAKADGRKAKEVRDEATAADKARDAAHGAWRDARRDYDWDVSERMLKALGLPRLRNVQQVFDSVEYKAAMRTWLIEHTEPETPPNYARVAIPAA